MRTRNVMKRVKTVRMFTKSCHRYAGNSRRRPTCSAVCITALCGLKREYRETTRRVSLSAETMARRLSRRRRPSQNRRLSPLRPRLQAVSQEAPDTLEPLRYSAPEAPEIAFRIDWEQILGRNWFAIIGGIAVVLGIGFFLKLAFDNNWINDIGRVALGVVVGIGFLGVGEYAQRRVPRWAQAVTASGAAILYLTIYAAFGLYQLISPTAAFLLLAVVDHSRRTARAALRIAGHRPAGTCRRVHLARATRPELA